MNRPTWFGTGVALIALGLLGLALPDSLEGRDLLPISPGHGISVLDAFALLPLVSGVTLLQLGIWRRREKLAPHFVQRPLAAAGFCFAAGLGLGLLLASALSSFFWWWAVGAFVLVGALVQTGLLASREDRNDDGAMNQPKRTSWHRTSNEPRDST